MSEIWSEVVLLQANLSENEISKSLYVNERGKQYFRVLYACFLVIFFAVVVNNLSKHFLAAVDLNLIL